jgi:DNA-binding transcriptional regulator LsrR (DeoR family)
MKDQSLSVRAAWLSYVGGYTQGEIAKRLNVSSTKVHRLIGQADKAGLIKVFIEGVPVECLELEDFLAERFGLVSCHVAPSLAERSGEEDDFSAVGTAAARYLFELLDTAKPKLIGVGKGRSLAAMVNSLPKIKRVDHKFVSVSGSLTRNLSANPFDVVHGLVEKTGGEGYFLPVPYITSSSEEKDQLMAQKSVQDVLGLARQADTYFVGVGSTGTNAHVRQVGMVSTDEWQELQDNCAVGDVMGSFVDINGHPVSASVNKQTLGLTLDDLRGKKVVAVVGGAGKGDAVLAALKTGVITDLIVGEMTAVRIKHNAASERLAS